MSHHSVAPRRRMLTCTPRWIAALLPLLWTISGPVASAASAPQKDGTEVITVPLGAATSPLPHFWDQMFGSGRAILTLRDDYRRDLRAVKQVTDFQYVRFHNIFHDEVGVVTRNAAGQLVYNFSYVDQIYDGLLDNGVRPFVELSFTPLALSSDTGKTMSFWYRPNVAPPKSYLEWDDLVRRFVAHLVERYGIDEVAKWYFEVWNEPNIEFWAGLPRQSTYFEFYEHTARDVKSIDSRLRVGGPATAQAAWVTDFLSYAREHAVPVDFVSSHIYANDTALSVFGEKAVIPRDRMVCRAVEKLHDEIQRSPFAGLPLFLSEYNASFWNETNVLDSPYMGPWLADTIRQCAGLVDMMSYWSFSDVFEEQGVVKKPFYGGYGLIAERGIPKPAYNAFALLHKLGDQRVQVDSRAALVTKRDDGALVIALWNYAEPARAGARDPSLPSASELHFTLQIEAVPADAHVTSWRLDPDHGNVLKAYEAMDRPVSPTRAQIAELKAGAGLSAPEYRRLQAHRLDVEVPPHGLVVLEVRP